MGRVIKLICYYLGYQILFLLLGIIVNWASYSIQIGAIAPFKSDISLSETLFWGLLATIANSVHLIYFRYIALNRTTLASGGLRTVALYLTMGVAFIFFFNCFSDWLELPNLMQETFFAAKDSIWGIIAICIGAPLFEEFLFRGAIQGHLQRIWKNSRWAIFASALLFAIVHGNPAQIVPAFLIGLVIGELYYLSGSLMPGILLHFVNNSISLYLMRLYPGVDKLDELIPTTTYWSISIVALVIGGVLYTYYAKSVKRNFSL